MLSILRVGPDSAQGLFAQIGAMHRTEIRHGLLPQLGDAFLSRLYRAVAACRHGVLFAALNADDVWGFIAGSPSIKTLYREILSGHGVALARHAAPALLAPTILAKAMGVALYPLKGPSGLAYPGPAGAELLAMAVAEGHRRRGLGGRLLTAFEANLLRDWGIGAYRVATNQSDAASNAFYRHYGLVARSEMRHNDLVLQVYVKQPTSGNRSS